MPRKPLTEAQYEECLRKLGDVCPRCGNEEDLVPSDPEIDAQGDGAECHQVVTCEECQETYTLVYVLARVVPAEAPVRRGNVVVVRDHFVLARRVAAKEPSDPEARPIPPRDDRPDVAVPPGATIRELLAERHLTPAELAERMRWPVYEIHELLHGGDAITPITAHALARHLGMTATFWEELEANYRTAQDALAETRKESARP